jgi:pimeloyl-ACP methyl ester carboxylesterase
VRMHGRLSRQAAPRPQRATGCLRSLCLEEGLSMLAWRRSEGNKPQNERKGETSRSGAPILAHRRFQCARRLTVSLLLLSLTLSAQPAFAENLERSVCRGEGFVFWLWRHMAKATAAKSLPTKGVAYSFTTSDHRTLRGYKLPSQGSPATGAVLFIQGNAMLAGSIIDDLVPLAEHFDVFVLDFRGYGQSEGAPRLFALLHDYRELSAHLRSTYAHAFIYGASLGGIIAANLGSEHLLDAVVVDSAPATLGSFGCPKSYDPLEHLPASCRDFLLISGGRDRIVKPAAAKPLLDRAASCHARVIINDEWVHPFMGSTSELNDRLSAAIAFFDGLPGGNHAHQ